MSVTYFVEDDMTCYRKSSVAGTNMFTGFAEFIVLDPLGKGLIKLSQVLVSLFPASGFLGEFRNFFQVGLSRPLYPEPSH